MWKPDKKWEMWLFVFFQGTESSSIPKIQPLRENCYTETESGERDEHPPALS